MRDFLNGLLDLKESSLWILRNQATVKYTA